MSVIPQTPRASGRLGIPGPPTVAVPWTLSGPQTPRLLTPPLTTNPGSAPGYYDLFALSIIFILVIMTDGQIEIT
jgi:hypothetical protein